MKTFDGKKIRDGILAKIQKDIKDGEVKAPHLAVFLIGDNPVCKKYVELKQKIAQRTGVTFSVYRFDASDTIEEILECIDFLNKDDEVDGIMIQIPVDEKFDQKVLIERINPEKDVDGLRYCLGKDSNFIPPVVLAVEKAISESGIDLANSSVALVGQGFLVGAPLQKYFQEKAKKFILISDAEKESRSIEEADIVISAVGKAGLIKADYVKDDAVLIDAGTAEVNGALLGDIDPDAFKKSSYFTPVPGGIGPVTVAMLIRNLSSSR